MEKLTGIVLAGGQGKRMKSSLPKVLHLVAGRPLVHYPIAAALAAGAKRVVVVASAETEGRIAAHAQAAFAGYDVVTTVQPVPRGTGDAAKIGMSAAGAAERVL